MKLKVDWERKTPCLHVFKSRSILTQLKCFITLRKFNINQRENRRATNKKERKKKDNLTKSYKTWIKIYANPGLFYRDSLFFMVGRWIYGKEEPLHANARVSLISHQPQTGMNEVKILVLPFFFFFILTWLKYLRMTNCLFLRPRTLI